MFLPLMLLLCSYTVSHFSPISFKRDILLFPLRFLRSHLTPPFCSGTTFLHKAFRFKNKNKNLAAGLIHRTGWVSVAKRPRTNPFCSLYLAPLSLEPPLSLSIPPPPSKFLLLHPMQRLPSIGSLISQPASIGMKTRNFFAVVVWRGVVDGLVRGVYSSRFDVFVEAAGRGKRVKRGIGG